MENRIFTSLFSNYVYVPEHHSVTSLGRRLLILNVIGQS